MTVPLCIDARMLHQSGTGVSTYARALQLAQARVGSETGTLCATASRLPPWLGALGSHRRRTALRTAPCGIGYEFAAADVFRRAHIHFGLTGRLLEIRPALPFGIMHWTYPIPLVMSGWANIYTVHDTIPITQPALSPVSGDRLLRTLRRIAEVADAVVTVSEASRQDLDGLGVFREAQLSSAGLGIAPPDAPDPARMTRTLAAAGLTRGRYLLFAGAVEQRKNVDRLLDAHQRSHRALPLVIAGPATRHGRAIEERIKASRDVIRLPYLPRPVLDEVLSGARALVFPSLAEGFGLPVVEAMARGTAVIASHIPAVAEIAGDAAWFVDPTCVDSMMQALNLISVDDSLVVKLRQRGLEQAGAYSIDAFSDRLAQVYRSVLDAAPSEHRGMLGQ